MDRRQFLVRAAVTGVSVVGAATLGETSALASTRPSTTKAQSSTERFLLGTARRALA